MKAYLLRFCVIAFLLFLSLNASASNSCELYVGQSTFVSCPNPPRGSIYQTSWASRHGAVSVTKDGTYGAKIKVSSYFTGTAQVQCDYYWRWYVGTRQYTNHATTYYNVTCKQVSIRMNQSGPITLRSGEGTSLSVTLSPSISPSPSVTWNSSNNYVAEVSQSGYVLAKQEGTAVISASSNAGSGKASVTINVQRVDVERAEVSPSSVNVLIDETIRLTLTTYPQYSKAESTSWHSRNPSVASVNSSGIVTGNSLGSTSVYCVVNGYISSNEVRVKVAKPQLILSADKPSGLYEKGTTVALDASKYGATIYYTLDGSAPTRKSNVYSEPIRLNENTVLKAFAVRDDCIDSEVLTREYNISSLRVFGTYPEKGVEAYRTHLVPTVNFTENIRLIDGGKGITLKNGNSTISGTVMAFGNSLSFVPDMNLKEGSYTLTIPQQVIMTASQEENFAYNFSFGVKGKSYGIADVCAGFQYSQVLTDDGTLWAWGRNDVGSIGNGGSIMVTTPIKILDNIAYTEAGGLTSAAIDKDETLYMWGYNVYGQLGNNSVKDSHLPVQVTTHVVKVITSSAHTLALTDNGLLFSWGYNWWGELGIGKQTQYQWSPCYVMNNVKDMAASFNLTLILTKDDELYACGYGGQGQLGNGYITNYYSTPHKVMDNVKKIAALDGASLVLKNDGTVWSFGDNKFCQLGVFEDVEYSVEPQMVLSGVKNIDAYRYTGAAVKTDDSLWLWGDNSYGQIGNGTKEKQKTPVKILSDVKKISVGDNHVLALTNEGKLYGWGDNACFEIADYKESTLLTPTLCPYFSAPVSPESLHLKSQKLKIGEHAVLVPSVSPVDAEYSEIEWGSSNPDVVAITDFGVVAGITEGSATIYCKMYNATGASIEASCDVSVSKDENMDTGIDRVITGNAVNSKFDPIYYNLKGIRVKNPGKGIYIKVQGGKKQKSYL